MKKQLEKPFEYLKRKDGTAFSPDIVKNWYKARVYVLNKLKNVTYAPATKAHLQVVVTSDTPAMLSVVRQVALSAHFPNFKETTGQNRSIITIVSKNPQIIEELKKEEYLYNLPMLCKYTLYGHSPVNPNSYIDIELQIVDEWHEDKLQDIVLMSEEEMDTFLLSQPEDEIYSIDTRKAVLTDRIYSLGTLIDNLPAEDINDFKRYKLALDVFQHNPLKEPITPLINEAKWENDLNRVKNGLSNVFTSDCFRMREAFCKDEGYEALSISEHARWVVDKLIMGFRPLNQQERFQDERLFGKEKSQFRSQLKKNPYDPVHINICSYLDLRRTDPEGMKYDTFLMMAIPMIQKHVR
jgi:hypothetical protein